MKKIIVNLEDLVYNVSAYELDPKGWNGWACPGFELDQAKLALDQLKYAQGSNMQWVYSGKFDGFLVKGMDQEGSEWFPGQTIETKDGLKKVYAIGAWSWIWSVS